MILKGTVTYFDSGELIAGASVYESDRSGNPLPGGNQTSTNEKGDFQLSYSPGNFVTARFVGTRPVIMLPAGLLANRFDFRLKNTATGPEVTVQSTRTYWGVAILAALALYSLSD